MINNYCRQNESSKQMEGGGCIVEVDKAKFDRRKYQRGRFQESQWVGGGVFIAKPKICS